MNKAEEGLRETRDYLKSLVESIADPIVTTDEKGIVTFFSEEAEEVLGYKREEVVGKHVSMYYKGGMEEAKSIMSFLKREEKARGYEMALISKDGEEILALLSASFLKDSEGKVIGTLGIFRDITEKKKLEGEIIETKEYLENLLENANDIICTLDLDGNITYVNHKIEEMGYKKDELIGKSFFSIVSKNPAKEKFRELILKRTKQTYEVEIEDKGGKIRNTLVSTSPLYDRQGKITGLLMLARDITDRKELEKELERLSITDSLTGLYNQRHFYNELKREVERVKRHHRPLSLLLFDVDRFKHYNDIYGHLEGDKALQKVGETISQNIRGNVDSGYRYGGDEFVVILPEADKNQSLSVAERIRESLKNMEINDTTLSVGLAEYHKGYDLETFINYADKAMYTSKHSGGDRVTVYEQGKTTK